MKIIRCYSVLAKDVIPVSAKAVKVISFYGDSDIYPISTIYKERTIKDYTKLWIAAWILKEKKLVYDKDDVYFHHEGKNNGRFGVLTIIRKHRPAKENPLPDNEIDELRRRPC